MRVVSTASVHQPAHMEADPVTPSGWLPSKSRALILLKQDLGVTLCLLMLIMQRGQNIHPLPKAISQKALHRVFMFDVHLKQKSQ